MVEEIEEDLLRLIQNERDAYSIGVFRRLYQQYRSEPSQIDWDLMKLLSAEHYGDYVDVEMSFKKYLNSKPQSNDKTVASNGERVEDDTAMDEEVRQRMAAILSRLVVVKLNGGLGTTMHCSGPKSLIELRDGLSFLDFVLIQNQKLNERFGSQVPLLLMNSFNTDAQTQKALSERSPKLRENVRTFVQSRCPRIYADTLRPLPSASNDYLEEGWYPPGHGNVFESLHEAGILDELLANGRDVAFISNIDNTGAVVEPAIATAMVQGIADYLMEVTPRTATDIKGGAVIEYCGALMHLEMPQVPHDKIDEFCSLRTFKIFNTNNIWVNLRAVKERIAQMSMEILANHKKLSSGREVIQLETSVGGAIRNFKRALCLRVARSRFLPVKSTQEMLPLMSNAYFTDAADGVVKLGGGNRPLVTFSPPNLFSSIHQLRARFASVPDLSEAHSLKIVGDVQFGINVKIVGHVEVVAKDGEKIFIEDNTILSG